MLPTLISLRQRINGMNPRASPGPITPQAAGNVPLEGIQNVRELLVPSISIYEVFKRVLQQRGESPALQAIAIMQQGQVVDLDLAIALHAAKTSVELSLPMADSILLATAQMYEAMLWTQDADFANIEGVKYVERTR